MNDVERAYDALADGYDAHHVDGKSRAEDRLIRAVLARLLPGAARIVDLGSGTGLLLDLVPVLPARYLGVDISSRMLERARAKYPAHRFVHADYERPHEALPDAGFDVVVSLFGSASYGRLPVVAEQVRRLLAPGGRYFIMFCGPRYLRRSTYINRDNPLLTPHSAAELTRAFPGARIWGMSALVDHLPDRLPDPVWDAAMRLDAATAGRAIKDRCFFLNVQGRR